MNDLELRYYYDPLCGWCYASADALAVLAQHHGGALRLMPTGQFFEPRPVAAIADHAWRNDQRIGQLTGQRFSEDYRRNVLEASRGVFSSKALSLAIEALGEGDPSLEARFLHAAQVARYVDGKDTSRIEEVVRVAEAFAGEIGLPFDAGAFADQLRSDEALMKRVDVRMAAARADMASLPSGGVPLLVIRSGGKAHAVSGQTLYAGGRAMLDLLGTLSVAA